MTHSFAALDHAFDLAKDKKYDEALGICNNFVLNWPHAYAGYYRKSNVLSMMGRHDDALRALDKVAELLPERAFSYSRVPNTIGKPETINKRSRITPRRRSAITASSATKSRSIERNVT